MILYWTDEAHAVSYQVGYGLHGILHNNKRPDVLIITQHEFNIMKPDYFNMIQGVTGPPKNIVIAQEV